MLTILFDLDDTLYDTASPFFRALDNYRMETSYSDEATFALFREHCDAAFDLFSRGNLTLAESHIMRTQHTFADLGLPLTSEEAMHFQETYQKRQAEITLSPGIEQLLNELEGQNIPIAVFTNGPEKHQMKKFNCVGPGEMGAASAYLHFRKNRLSKTPCSGFRACAGGFGSAP